MPDFSCPQEFIAFANRLADASGEVIRRYFRQPFVVEGKDDLSPVTKADRDAERALRAMIEKTYPSHGIHGEEYGLTNASADYTWVLDPIDGTRAFVCGKPVWGTLIALLRKGKPILGVIDQPVLHERWIGAFGYPTTLNGKEIKTRACASLSEAVLNIAPQVYMEKYIGDLPAYRKLERKAKTTSVGGDCYVYGLLASGFVDVIVEQALKLYDFAALVPIIEGAGGMMTDWQGKVLDVNSAGYVLAAGDKRVGQEALKLIGKQDEV
jgi:histidinol phosphatase-like enzyme (inositol monophosphatase family)